MPYEPRLPVARHQTGRASNHKRSRWLRRKAAAVWSLRAAVCLALTLRILPLHGDYARIRVGTGGWRRRK